MRNSRVAILIPTLNRPSFIKRQLSYYKYVGSKHPVYIGDGSTYQNSELVKEIIKEFDDFLEIHYFYWPEFNDRQTDKALAENVAEKYCCLCGDDDFFIPNTLTYFAGFLESNSEYHTVRGDAFLFELDRTGAFGEITSVSLYGGHDEINAETSILRVTQLAKKYWVPIFSVQRTRNFLKAVESYTSIPCRVYGELVHAFTTIAYGKTKYIDKLYLVRQVHGQRYIENNGMNWITSDNWYKSYEIFMNQVVDSIAITDKVNIKLARNEFKKIFDIYLLECTQVKTLKVSKTKQLLKNILRQCGLMDTARSLIKYINNDIDVNIVSKKKSRFYVDFKNIRDIVVSNDVS